MVKNLPANAGEARFMGSIPRSGRPPGETNDNHSSIVAWETPWMEEPDSNGAWGHKELNTTEQLSTHSTDISVGSLFTQIDVQNFVLNK